MNKNKIVLLTGIVIVLVLAIVLVVTMLDGKEQEFEYTGMPEKTTGTTTEVSTQPSTEDVTLPEETTAPQTETTAPTEATEATEPTPTTQPTEPKPTEPKPTEPKPTEPKPTEPKPTEPKPTEPTKPNSGGNPAEREEGDITIDLLGNSNSSSGNNSNSGNSGVSGGQVTDGVIEFDKIPSV